ncbi:MAG: glycosyltransferase family 4 protein [Gemmatimonadetes bacterium]|uniref:Glycosyltransferase family 4 protein n=1 Tax=Candidatus Kutchimonas denitrificans TaxID=3056748 RepID=A0AAE5C8V7_9BACT|nr:glycosyltransferase family 4 protein [Gemmatimonadota bacterium]NIR74836.1 glycosyltransferase family 4 protein [Candidatus Kutchimonas denitrificans]NIR99947.1 glycosyltransferase family 4 protein [Gemmatimonadota bacterium]NIT65531.1 glycosyltransferase family 4 protein [Gemmatimonadota bacterium]NIU52501.1 glycosyltransferase [Gemmatimonadota bacterium]
MAEPLTIVEVTGRLGIGGVETHVSRLARGLMGRGHRVVLLTRDPGVYGDEAKDAGADLMVVPFNRSGLPQAVELLLPIEPDIVHAHNYRAARFGAPLARALERPYLMTVHGPRPWWKRIFFDGWSNTILTVSEADKDHIVGPFGVSADRIEVGFLGVDTEEFRPGLDTAGLRADWDVPDDRPLILNVSRFTHRKARPALTLIEALPAVREEIPGTCAVLVGTGDELDRMHAAAEEGNRRLRERATVVAGPRTDIPRVMNAADVVVATATTATEALAAAAPTIAYGRTGYFGIVTPDNFERARALCFADHGRLPAARPETFAADLVALLRDPAAARRAAAEARNIIATNYSVERMVDHVESVYRRLIESG